MHVQEFLEAVSPHVSIERQMNNLISCMSVLFSYATLDVEDMNDFYERYGGGTEGRDVRSEARQVH